MLLIFMAILLSDRVIKAKYDVIVIGAGLGGLTTASLLAKRGVDVLLIEQHCLPGGACTSFRREGRIYDSGAALIFGFGKDGYHLHRNLINLLEEPITVIPRDKFFRLNFAGKHIMFWKSLEKFLPELQSQFPEQKDEIANLYRFLINFYTKYMKDQDLLTPPSELSNPQKLKMFFSHPIKVLNLTSLLSKSAEDLMKPYLKSQLLTEFFDKLCASYAYITMRETPAIMALTMFADNHIGGTYYLAGSAQTYSNTLERAIERNGGSTLYHRRVQKIVFQGERASGVQLSDGTIIHADRIVSDTTVWNLYNTLIPQDKVTEEQHRWVNSLVSTYPATVLYAAVDKKALPADVNPVEYFISNTSEIDMGDITMYIPTVDDFSLGPKDEHLITVFSPSPNEDWPNFEDKDYQSSEYYAQKKKKGDAIIAQIEKQFPGFQKGIKKLYIASPSTVERYTLKNKGCVGGPKQMIGQELMKRLHAQTPWLGVYACGDSTTMGMGTPAVIGSGFGAANLILRELGKPEFHNQKFKKEYVTYIPENPAQILPDEFDGTLKAAKIIARACQDCEKPACRAVCPAGIDIPGFIRRIEAENINAAAKLIRDTNPLAEICGLICPSEKLCEKVCIRAGFAQKPVQIKILEKWVAQTANGEGWANFTNGAPIRKKIAVIGAGPSGLTCAHYLARIGYDIDLFDAQGTVGGKLLELVASGKLANDSLNRELKGIMLPSIHFHGNWRYTDKKQLAEILRDNAGVYLTVKSDLEYSEDKIVKDMPTVVVGGQAYAPAGSSYELIHAIRDGRHAAMLLNTINQK